MASKNEAQFLNQLETKVTERGGLPSENQKSIWLAVINEYLLVKPWRTIIILALLIALLLVLLFQERAVKGVSWLQWGF